MRFDRKYLISALGFAAIGMCLGIVMAASKDHAQHVTHAHILLIGFVVSMIYAIVHKLWLTGLRSGIARLQFVLHHLGAVGIGTGLFLLYGRFVTEEKLEPLLSISSIAVLIAVLLMLWMVIKSPDA
ncbi:hypothetical protein [Undibacterium fentianense]|uniref:Uncharacterized protein n=1 Tax=Undibacterium fentianense TaxID=2828728 RepID=A0A941EAW9_9BURK|nr:hypothetical protein [Undibacterium fentianense]MBR7801743.1 hypothetical protein [Undibacterium fentianense]